MDSQVGVVNLRN